MRRQASASNVRLIEPYLSLPTTPDFDPLLLPVPQHDPLEKRPLERIAMSAKTIVCRVSMVPGGDATSRKSELLNSIRESLETTELQHLNAIEI